MDYGYDEVLTKRQGIVYIVVAFLNRHFPIKKTKCTNDVACTVKANTRIDGTLSSNYERDGITWHTLIDPLQQLLIFRYNQGLATFSLGAVLYSYYTAGRSQERTFWLHPSFLLHSVLCTNETSL